MRPQTTSRLGFFPPDHKYGMEDKWGANCSCVAAPPQYWWVDSARPPRWHRGNWPTELCRCMHCGVLCPGVNATWSYQHVAAKLEGKLEGAGLSSRTAV